MPLLGLLAPTLNWPLHCGRVGGRRGSRYTCALLYGAPGRQTLKKMLLRTAARCDLGHFDAASANVFDDRPELPPELAVCLSGVHACLPALDVDALDEAVIVGLDDDRGNAVAQGYDGRPTLCCA